MVRNSNNNECHQIIERLHNKILMLFDNMEKSGGFDEMQKYFEGLMKTLNSFEKRYQRKSES